MSRETKIVEAACLMISQYGPDAVSVARRRIRELMPSAPKAAAEWDLVASAVQMIENDGFDTVPAGPALPGDLMGSISGFDLPSRRPSYGTV